MKLNVLISTMFCENVLELVHKMNIQTDCVVVNQCDIEKEKIQEINDNGKKIIFVSTNDRGLSNSRNKALRNTPEDTDVVIFTDDDIVFNNDYEKNILKVYENNNIDGCSFYVMRFNGKLNKKLSKKINKITMLRVCSVSMTFKYKSIKNIKFDTRFGTGSGKFILGEENIFIGDCLDKGLNIISNEFVLCNEYDMRQSTWYKGMNEEYFISRGACFKRIYKYLYWLFILDFAFRKQKRYKKNISVIKAIKLMFKGSSQI